MAAHMHTETPACTHTVQMTRHKRHHTYTHHLSRMLCLALHTTVRLHTCTCAAAAKWVQARTARHSTASCAATRSAVLGSLRGPLCDVKWSCRATAYTQSRATRAASRKSASGEPLAGSWQYSHLHNTIKQKKKPCRKQHTSGHTHHHKYGKFHAMTCSHTDICTTEVWP